MLEDHGGDAKRHIGARGVKPVLSFARKRTAPNRSGPWLEISSDRFAQLEVQLQAKLQDARISRGADLIVVPVANRE